MNAAAVATLLAMARTTHADRIDEYLRAQLAKNHIPALSLAVIRDGKLEKLQSYGVANLEWDSPAADDSRYQLASATKPFTGTLLMQLVEQGKLALDDSVAKFLPEAPESWKPITVRDLGTHMSGLKEVDAGKLATVDAIVAAAMREPLGYEPRTRSTYGFTDYVVLARIMERVSGKPYADLLRDGLAKPLGMTATGFDFATEDGPMRVAHVLSRRTTVYRWDGAAQRVFEFLYGIPGYSAGGLYSSASDLARFFAALQQGRLLNPKSLGEMWTRPPLRGGGMGDFGLGWVVGRHQGRLTVGHSGGPALADLLYFPDEKLAIVVLLNQQRMFPYLAEGIADLVLPPGKLPPSIEDTDAPLTARLRAVLASAAEGKPSVDAIAEASRTELVRTLEEMGPIVIGMLEPIRGLELVEERRESGRWTRKYRVLFGQAAKYWLFELTADGRIAAMRPVSE